MTTRSRPALSSSVRARRAPLGASMADLGQRRQPIAEPVDIDAQVAREVARAKLTNCRHGYQRTADIRAEFLVEPFVEGAPGHHVTMALEARRSHGLEPEMGPFAT